MAIQGTWILASERNRVTATSPDVSRPLLGSGCAVSEGFNLSSRNIRSLALSQPYPNSMLSDLAVQSRNRHGDNCPGMSVSAQPAKAF